jgi:hypothetical protein
VFDADIYVSAFALGCKPKRAVQLAIPRRVDAAISEPIRTEVLRTLRGKFRWSEARQVAPLVEAALRATNVRFGLLDGWKAGAEGGLWPAQPDGESRVE